MERRHFLRYAAGAAAVWRTALPPRSSAQTEDLEETTIQELQNGMQSGRFTARSLAEHYLARIDAIDRSGPSLRAVLETNPAALEIADALDRERKEKGPR